MTPDLVYKRDVLRRRLGTELGDRVFREWLERALAAVAPEEAPVTEPPPPAARPWSDAERAFVRAGYAAAVPPARIAAALGRSRRGVIACAHWQRGAEAPSKGGQTAIAPADQPLAPPEAAPGGERSSKPADHDRPGPAIAPTTQRERLTEGWSEEDVRTLRERYAGGDHHADIADLLGRTPNSVLGKIHRLGLRADGAPRRRRKRPTPAVNAGDGRGGRPPCQAAGEEPVASTTPDAAGSIPAPRSDPATISTPSPEEPEIVVPEPQPAPRGGCLWIEDALGDPGFPSRCGAQRSPGRPYCIEHCLRAFVSSEGKRFPRGRSERPPAPQRRRRSRAA